MTTSLLGKLGTEKVLPVMDCSWNYPDCVLFAVILFLIRSLESSLQALIRNVHHQLRLNWRIPWPEERCNNRCVYQFAQAALSKDPKLGGLNNRNLSSNRSGGGGLGSRCPQAWFLLRVLREDLFQVSYVTSGALLAIFGIHSLAYRSVILISDFTFTACSPCPTSSPYKDIVILD